jgi:hypothetical protein
MEGENDMEGEYVDMEGYPMDGEYAMEGEHDMEGQYAMEGEYAMDMEGEFMMMEGEAELDSQGNVMMGGRGGEELYGKYSL